MKNIIVANWKMNLDPKEAVKLVNGLKKQADKAKAEIVVCPDFVSLLSVGEAIKKSKIVLGAQDCFWQTEGAYTGEISPRILKSAGVKYVICGHSERRQNLGETGEMINRKIDMVIESGLTPIFCVGESFDERQDDQTGHILYRQLKAGLKNIHLIKNESIVIAYEPVWAIGTGHAVMAEQLADAVLTIRHTLTDIWPTSVIKEKVRIIYGGSVDNSNVADFIKVANMEGFLIGNASLKTSEFIKIIKNF